MKKMLISLLLLVPFLTGCASIDTQLTLNDDKSASVVTSLTYMGDLSDKNDIVANVVADNYSKFLDPYYTVDKVSGAKLSTFTAKKSVKNVKYSDLDLSSLGFKSNLPSGKFVELKKNFLITSFNIDCTYDLQAQKPKVDFEKPVSKGTAVKTLEPEYFQKYADVSEVTPDNTARSDDFIQNLDEETKSFVEKAIKEDSVPQKTPTIDDLGLSFSIKVPSLASFNNADSIDGNVYSWNISKDKPTNIKLQYVQYSGFAIAFIIILGVGLLVLLARKILKHDSQKRIDN